MALKIKTITIRTIDNEDFKQQILHLGKTQRQIAKAGTDHWKFMRMMPVYVRITAPLYW